MNSVYHDIFKAIHEGKWLDIEYKNKENDITKYWIGIYDLNVRDMTLSVEGLHLAKYTTKCFDFIYIDSILSSKIIESSYFPINQKLVNDISLNPHKFKKIFDNTANLKILNYLEMCNRMDTIPYYSDFQLIEYIDRDSFNGEEYALNPEQFQKIVNYFHYSNDKKKKKSVFSSTGLTADGRIKPDVVALGTGSCVTGPDGNIQYASGTSFATPILAGLGVCLWQALPGLDSQSILNLLRRYSSQYKHPDGTLGYGIPDVYKAYKKGRKHAGKR